MVNKTNVPDAEDWKRTLDALPDLICTLDTEHKVRWMNAAMANKLGITQAEAKGLTCYETVHGTNCPPDFCPHRQLLLDKQEHAVEVHEDRLGGYFLVTCTPLTDKDGRLVGSVHVARDITESKRAEEQTQTKAQEQEWLLRSMMNAFVIFHSVFDQDGRFISYRFEYINDAYERITGVKREEVCGKTVHEVWPETEASWIEQYGAVAVSGIPRSFDMYHKPTAKLYHCNVYRPWETAERFCVIFDDITERKQAEDALRRNEKDLRESQRIAHVGSWRLDVATNEVVWTEELYNMYGFDPSLPPPPYTEHMKLFTPESWERLSTALARTRDTGIPYTLELETVRKDGSNGWMWVRGEVDVDRAGKTVGLWGAAQDITERKRSEEALKASEEKLKSIFRVAPTGIGVVNDRILIEVNPRICEMTGYSSEELLGQSARILYPSQNEYELVGKEKYAQIARCGTGTVETLWQRKDGKIIDILLSSTPVDSNDLSKGVTFTAIDITERKQAEAALRTNEARYRQAQAIGHVGNWEYNIQTTQFWGSDEAKRIYGFDPAKSNFTTNEVEKCIPERERVHQALVDLIEAEKPYDLEFEIIPRNTSESRIITSIAELEHDEHGNPLRVVGVIQDITERKRMEEEKEKLQAQLSQSQKMESVGRLAGGVAHDFNNMLQAILGHAELALLKVGPDETLYADLKEIQNAAGRSADLTRQLLAFARKQTVAPRVLDLNETVEGMLKMLRRLIGEDIDLAWMPGSNIGPVFIDPSQMDQILANLCVNARDAIEGTGKITIETDSVSFDEAYCAGHAGFIPGDFVMLAVSDDGCGMDARTLSHLFEPFFTTKDIGKGTGLGLATVYGAIRQNNGFINVYSEPGHGTTFKIYLPLYAAKAALRPEQESDLAPATGGETILLVEDEPAILKMTTLMLESMGYSVIVAATPGEAIRLAREHTGRIDLLMTDVVMPEMNGRELAVNLMSIYPDIGRLFMSGYTANVIAHQGVLDQGVHFIQKPFSIKGLSAKIREALNRE